MTLYSVLNLEYEWMKQITNLCSVEENVFLPWKTVVFDGSKKKKFAMGSKVFLVLETNSSMQFFFTWKQSSWTQLFGTSKQISIVVAGNYLIVGRKSLLH